MKTPDDILVSALRTLANDIKSDDGVANAVVAEAADRIEELARLGITTRQLADAWRAACRYLYEVIGEEKADRACRPMDLISNGDYGRVITMIGRAESLDDY